MGKSKLTTMIAEAIIKILLASADITSLVGNRVEPSILKLSKIYPSIYVSSDRMSKPACSRPNGLRIGAIEVGVYADTYRETGAIIEAIRKTLDDFEGMVQSVGIRIQSGQDTGDKYDDIENKHVKIIEYDAAVQIYN